MLPQIMKKTNGPVAALAARRSGSSEHWFNSQGELNASSRSDVISSLSALMNAVNAGQVKFVDPNVAETASTPVTKEEKRLLITAAFNDRRSDAWAEIGTTISNILYETAEREGFARRFMEKGDLAQGSFPRINVRFQNVTMFMATGPSVVAPLVTNQRYVQPAEFYINGNVRVSEMDIAQGAADLLDDTYARALENIFVKEDRTYLTLLDRTVGSANPLYLMAGGATPANVAAVRNPLITWGLSAEHMIIAADYWADIAGNASAFGNLFDPVTQYELVQTGFLGTLLGMKITTDGFRDPAQRVVKQNDGYIISSAINHGAYTDRGPVNAQPIDTYPEGIPARGWFFWEIMSMAVVNPRSVVKFRRV